MALICDTGPLLAALDAADADHRDCARLLTEAEEDLVVPALVLVLGMSMREAVGRALAHNRRVLLSVVPRGRTDLALPDSMRAVVS